MSFFDATDFIFGIFLGLVFCLVLMFGVRRSFSRELKNVLEALENRAPLTTKLRSLWWDRVHLRRVRELVRAHASDGKQSQFEALTKTLELLDEGVLVVDSRGCFQFVNPAGSRLLSLSSYQGFATPTLEALRHLELREALKKFLGDEERILEETFRLSGDLQVYVRVHRLVQETHGFLGAVVLVRDVSRLRLLEKHRREFVANVSHEMKTPLTLIKASIETLEEDTNLSSQQRYLIELVKHNSDNLIESMEALLILSRLDESGYRVPMESLRVREFLEKIRLEFLERARGRQVSLELEDPTPDLVLEGSGPLLAKAVGNLIDNAIKHNEPGTRVRFGAQRSGEGILQFFVEDNGRGLPEEELPRIFERFYRPKSQSVHQGSGLGLSLVKNIAKAHRGDVRVSSRLGESSIFFLELPEQAH